MLVRLLGPSQKGTNRFADLKGSEWYAESILKVAAAGIMLGDELGNCNGNKPISRQETMVMFARAMGLKPVSNPDLSDFADGDSVASWAAGYIAPLAKMGIVNGTVPGKMVADPTSNINRASTLALLDKAVRIYITTPGEYEVNEPNGFVVVNVAGNGDVTVSGQASGVVVASGTANADVTLKDMSADTVRVDGTADVALDGETTVGSLSANVAGDLVIGENAAVEDLDANAAANIVNNGEVANLNTNADDVVFNGNAPEAVNTAEGVEPATDSEGNEVTAGTEEPEEPTPNGGSTTTIPSAKKSDVVAAPIVDQIAEHAIAADKLGKVTVTGTQSGTTHRVTVTGKAIVLHNNAQDPQAQGHWVGFGMPTKLNEDGTSAYTYEVDGVAVPTIAGRTYEVSGKTYNTVYFSYDTEEEFKAAAPKVVVKEGDKTVATYNVKFNVTFYKADVKLSMDLIDETDRPYFGQFAIKTLFGSKATLKDYTITIKGEIDPEKLNNDLTQNISTGEFAYYGLTVTKDDVAARIENGGYMPSNDPWALYDMAARLYNTETGETLKTAHTYELKDAAGRTQQIFTVVVDATACTVKGLHQVAFGDTVYNKAAGDMVTAPAVPESTDEVYYTGNWVSGSTVVKAGESYTVTGNITFKAESIAVGAQTLKDRPNGPAGDIADFDYAAAYADAGVKLTGSKGEYTYTVDADKFLAYADQADNKLAQLAATVEGTSYYFYGAAIMAPTNAAKMTITNNKAITSLENAENYTAYDLATSEHKFTISGQDCIVEYFGAVAEKDSEGNYGFQPDGSFTRFVKWEDAQGKVLAVNKFVLSRVTTEPTPVEPPVEPTVVELTATPYDFSCPDGVKQYITFTLKNGDEAFEIAQNTVTKCEKLTGEDEWTEDTGAVLFESTTGNFAGMDRTHQLGWTLSRKETATTQTWRFTGADGKVYVATFEVPSAIPNDSKTPWGDTQIDNDHPVDRMPVAPANGGDNTGDNTGDNSGDTEENEEP
ncbi:MAG: S-layer homology domain-containing protein [Roseburia sp.]|nr:S-layer homology domain-containing protein [Roseburia sp.]